MEEIQEEPKTRGIEKGGRRDKGEILTRGPGRACLPIRNNQEKRSHIPKSNRQSNPNILTKIYYR
jgi:hypothetical protein